MLVYSVNNFPVGFIDEFSSNLSLVINNKKTISTIFKKVYDAIKWNIYIQLQIKQMKDTLSFLGLDELLKLKSLNYPYSYVFILEDGSRVRLISLHKHITNIKDTSFEMLNKKYNIEKVEITFSPVSYLVEILNWQIKKEMFSPIVNNYKKYVKKYSDYLFLQPEKQFSCRALSIVTKSLIDYVLQYVTLRNMLIMQTAENTLLHSPIKIDTVVYRVYTLDIKNKQHSILVTENMQLPKCKTIEELNEMLLLYQNLFNPRLLRVFKQVVTQRKPFKFKEVMTATSKDDLYLFLIDCIKNTNYLPFKKTLNYTEKTKLTTYEIDIDNPKKITEVFKNEHNFYRELKEKDLI